MEGPLSDLPISFRENRKFAALATGIAGAVGLVPLWYYHVLATHGWTLIFHVKGAPTLFLIAPVLVLGCLWMLMWSARALIFAPVFLEVREEGLWFWRLGLIPWSAIGATSLEAYETKVSTQVVFLYIKIKGLQKRIRALPRLARYKWRLISALNPRSASLWLNCRRFRLPPIDVQATIEAHRPKATP
ncbi:hypothetical protein [Stagnihabitans tardus]|uniref:Uncharacterized protein n=1 Tax=Stagnihabitans tardus TaxID=2699202 RepID=A0AAE4YB71_9RHOB|nr:hypothetical protein [Stagnihabitans tardus]NBZ88472.1 hypothetical protein [Stagnihabitans tardus]